MLDLTITQKNNRGAHLGQYAPAATAQENPGTNLTLATHLRKCGDIVATSFGVKLTWLGV